MTTIDSPQEPRFLPLGDAALTVEFGRTIEPDVHARVLGFTAALDRAVAAGELQGVVESVPTFRSVTVHFDPDRIGAAALQARLFAIARVAGSGSASGARWCLPVCCAREFAPDLDDIAHARGLAPDTVLDLLTQTVFRVYMLGFLPGFAFMGGLPAALEMPRLASPRERVPAGSVAIAQRLCGAYPWESPGGWRLWGRTPVPLFDAARSDRPALLAPGDEVRWRRIERDEYDDLLGRCRDKAFDRAALLLRDGAPRGTTDEAA